MSRPFTFLLFSLLFWLFAGEASAEVRRCVTPDGKVVFTDRACLDLGGVERPQHASPSPGATRVYRSGCARNLEELVFELTTAIDARDANRLASVYHWAGMAGSTGYEVWNRLDRVAKRPLVDIVPVMPASPVASPTSILADENLGGNRVDDGSAEKKTGPLEDERYPQAAARRTPIGLRIEQTLGNSSTPSRTVFELTRHFGCWWVRF